MAIVFTILRTTIRAQLFRTLSADDASVIFALLVLVAVGVLCTYATPAIYELYVIDQPRSSEILVSPDVTDQLNYFLRLQFAIIALFWTSVWAVKFSFLITINDSLRVFQEQITYLSGDLLCFLPFWLM